MKKIVEITSYSQNGDGVAFLENQKPVYVPGSILGEKIEIQIIQDEKKFCRAKIINIIAVSSNRNNFIIKNAEKIGGYELIHMNEEEQKNFKIQMVFQTFIKISKIELREIEWFASPKQFHYRNKITLTDGSFYQKNTKNLIKVDDFLLSDIPYDANKPGKIIYRKLDTLISGTKEDTNLFTTDTMLGYSFRVNINAFYQINKEVAMALYSEVKDEVIQGGNTLDLYSGIATIAIIVSDRSKKVIGVESSKYSYNDAIFNINNNNIKNVEFIKSDVLKFFNKTQEKDIDTVIIDPARNGAGKEVILRIKKLAPKKIIYVSCNLGKQAYETSLLLDEYEVRRIKVFDMFPQTFHIESLVVLEKK